MSLITSCNSTPSATTVSSNPQTTPNQILTQPLTSTPIKITLADLPAPYATESASKPPKVISVPANPVLNVPEGFKVNVFADNLPNVRWLTLTPEGDVLAVQSKQNKINLLQDKNQDGVAENRQIFGDRSNGLDQPLGMTFSQGSFYVANTGEVLRYNYQSGQLKLDGAGEKITQLTPGGYNQHWTRNIVTSPDGQKLYVSIGSKSNADTEELPRASIQVMNLDGSQRSTYAYGLRNPVGLDFHPVTGKLYTTVNERDQLGDDLVPDYFTQVKQGGFYGWPYAYLAPNLLDPRHLLGEQSTQPDLAAKTLTPDVLFQAHSAALGVQFYDQQKFPSKYHNGAFVAFRGSWNRDRGTGYKIVFIPFDKDNQPLGYYEDFLTGFLTNPDGPSAFARPVGLLVLPDGSLLLAEDGNGRIYRISYGN
ncbi:NHL repeat containing protein [Chondrocystis sp. NIES-4102]|nr:NHL repeat containing protein [Chondrocystis sp. NIES-4102]